MSQTTGLELATLILIGGAGGLLAMALWLASRRGTR